MSLNADLPDYAEGEKSTTWAVCRSGEKVKLRVTWADAKLPDGAECTVLVSRLGIRRFASSDPTIAKVAPGSWIGSHDARYLLPTTLFPLVVTRDGRVFALDAKLNFDDSALYRHGDIVGLRDIHEEDPLEVEASKFSLNYIKLDGTIGCMVNGAGLAMATMDIIKLAGGEPANFLDVGGGASQERVEQAFKILLADQNVKAVLINIFGGIVRCDMVANGVVAAAKNLGVSIPIVARLEGTNVEEGRRVLEHSDIGIIPATGMADAAAKVVSAANAQF
jgi:succinyl-CoA synthetase beta subunit